MRTQVSLHKQKPGIFFQSMWEKPHGLALTFQLYLKQFSILHVTCSFFTDTSASVYIYIMYTYEIQSHQGTLTFTMVFSQQTAMNNQCRTWQLIFII